MSKYGISFAFVLVAIMFTSCDKEEPMIPNEEELITTLNYSLTPVGGGETLLMSFTDLDGDGGNEPIIVGQTLAANQSYNARLELLNESETPAEDITEEIDEESADHQFFFQTNISEVSFSYDDVDSAGDPLGLMSTLNTGSAGSGTITITLRHEPNKSGEGVTGGDITNAGGETDIEVTFPVNVQ